MKDKRHWVILGSTALITASLLSGCSSSETKEQPAQSAAVTPPPSVTQNQAAESPTKDRPGRMEGQLVTGTATVKAINKKKRVVTLKTRDGKELKVKCGPDVRNFSQIRVGDEVTTTGLETVELFVTGEEKPSAERATEVERAPLGSKPGFSVIDTIEVKASVVDIDYQTRDVTLKGPDDKVITVKAGPEVKRLNEVKSGDTVVERVTRAMSIMVSTPEKN